MNNHYPQDDQMELAAIAKWAATGVGWLSTFAGFVITAAIAIYACYQSDQAGQTAAKANQIARSALQQNEILQRDKQDFARRMQDYEISLTTPRLVLLRFKRITATRYVATIQNDGQRQAAIFGVHLHPGRATATMGSMGEHPIVPDSIKMPTIDVPFTDPSITTVDLPIPAIVDAGDIVSIEITFTEEFSEGEIIVDQAIGQPLRAGRYRVRESTTLFPSAPRLLDNDLFEPVLPPTGGSER